ncbi:MAG: MFS transporter [Bacteroidales bacterium]|nr:MFS transporter [Bacteroidales bacterium]
MDKNIKLRLIIMNWMQFAVWGAYLTSMGGYLASIGLGDNIGWFYSVQGIVSIFMPALMGIIADRWVPAQRLLGLCHLVAAMMMAYVGYIGLSSADIHMGDIFPFYTISVAFYMPTLALSNSVSYNALEKANLDMVKCFPPIRTFGTVGFIASMWIVDLLGYQQSCYQFFVCATWGVLMAIYTQTLPSCPVSKGDDKTSIADVLGLKAFSLFKNTQMCLFFIFSMLLGVSLQITNGYASPFIQSFAADETYQGAFFVDHSNILISLSQVSETLCILLIPFCLKRFGIKNVMLIAMLAWVGRFGLFAIGYPVGIGIVFLICSMIVYGVAFDFFNISGSLFVDQSTDQSIRSSAQGLFMLMTNGLGATVGTLSAQAVVNHYTTNTDGLQVGDWNTVWTIFATYALVIAIAFALIFRTKKETKD